MTATGPIQALLEAEKKQKKEMRERQNSVVAQAAARRSSLQGLDPEATLREPVVAAASLQRRASSSSARVSVSGINSQVEVLARPTESSKIRKSIANQDLQQAQQAAARRQSLRIGPEAVNAIMASAEAPKVAEAEETEEQKQKWDNFHRRSSAFLESKSKQLEVLKKKQEQQQIQGCTFEPNADKPNRKRPGRVSQQRPSGSMYERSLEAEARKEERLRKRRQEMYDKEMAQCSFHPKVVDEASAGVAAPPRRRSVSSQNKTSNRASLSAPGSTGMPAYPRRSSSKPGGVPAVGYGAPKPAFQPPPRRGSGPVRIYDQMGLGNHIDDLDDRTQIGLERVPAYEVSNRENEEDEDCTTLLPPGMEEYREQAHRNEPQTLNELLARQSRSLPAEDAASSESPSQADSAPGPPDENLKVLERLQNRRRLLQETLETQDGNGRGGRTAGAGPGSGVPRPPVDNGARHEVCSSCGSDLTPDARFCGKCGTKVVKDSGQPPKPMASVSKSVAAAVDRMEGLLLDDRNGKRSPDQDWEDEETEEDSEEEAFSEEYDPNEEEEEEDEVEAEEDVSAEAPIFGRGSILDQASHGTAGAQGAAAFAKALGRQRHDEIPALQIPRHQQR
mmetsp:Transcript_93906/g.166153  ORF Transcript_93906/g.166153 Transcript_93906/m.166153 type:complete len:619 (-) Transcript_93906:112-1968(-)